MVVRSPAIDDNDGRAGEVAPESVSVPAAGGTRLQPARDHTPAPCSAAVA
jgi:hypothetical protein